MKKILFFIFAALAFVACEKEKLEVRSPYFYEPEVENQQKIQYSPKAVLLDRAKGGEVVITGDFGSFPVMFYPYKAYDVFYTKLNKVYFWDNLAENFPTLKEIHDVESYEALGCTIKLSPDFKRYTVKVDEDCKWDFIEVRTRLVNGYPGTSFFYIVLSPDFYDRFK